MTPKQLLEKYGGDPLAAAEDYDNLAWLDVPFDEDENLRLWVGSALSHQMRDFVESVIAHLGEDGAEKWGQGLWVVIGWQDFLCNRHTDIGTFSQFAKIYALTLIDGTRFDAKTVTAVANATDRERLAACIVALAEVERDA